MKSSLLLISCAIIGSNAGIANNVFGMFHFTVGDHNKLWGSGNTIFGDRNSFAGNNNLNVGMQNNVQGSGNWVTGANHNLHANGLKMFGPDAHPSFYGGSHAPSGFFFRNNWWSNVIPNFMKYFWRRRNICVRIRKCPKRLKLVVWFLFGWVIQNLLC